MYAAWKECIAIMSQLAAAIDFGTSKIAVVAGRLDERGALVVAGSGQVAYAGFRDDEWLDIDGLENAILTAKRMAEKLAGRRIRDVYVAVPGDFVRVVFNQSEVAVRRRDGIITREDIEDLLESAGHFTQPLGYLPLHRTPIAYQLENQTLTRPPVGERARSGVVGAYVSHVLAQENFIEDVSHTLANLGLGVLGFVAGPVGTGYLIRTQEETRRTAIVVDVGHYSMDILVAEGDGLVFHDNLPVGGGTITKDIAVVKHMGLDEAERMKRQLTLGLMRGEIINDRRASVLDELADAQEIAEARVWEMSRKVVGILKTLGMTYDGSTGVYLTGGGFSQLKGAKDILGAAIGKIVKVYSHPSPFLNSPTYTAAAGSLLYALTVLSDRLTLQGLITKIKDMF